MEMQRQTQVRSPHIQYTERDRYKGADRANVIKGHVPQRKSVQRQQPSWLIGAWKASNNIMIYVCSDVGTATFIGSKKAPTGKSVRNDDLHVTQPEQTISLKRRHKCWIGIRSSVTKMS